MTMHASMQCIKDKLATLSDFPVLESDCIRLRGIRESDLDGLYHAVLESAGDALLEPRADDRAAGSRRLCENDS